MSDLIVAVVWLGLLLVLLPRMRAIWRGGAALASLEAVWTAFWPYSPRSLRAWLRATVAMYVGGYFLLLMTVGVLIRGADKALRPWLAATALIGLAGTVAMVALAVSIVLFNRPKWLALPAMRSDEGLLARTSSPDEGPSSRDIARR